MTQVIPLSATGGKLAENGLVSPTGHFFPCMSGKHDITCQDIIGANRDYLEHEGWVFIINCQIWLVHPEQRNWTITTEQHQFLREYINQYPDPTSMFWELRVTKTKRNSFSKL